MVPEQLTQTPEGGGGGGGSARGGELASLLPAPSRPGLRPELCRQALLGSGGGRSWGLSQHPCPRRLCWVRGQRPEPRGFEQHSPGGRCALWTHCFPRWWSRPAGRWYEVPTGAVPVGAVHLPPRGGDHSRHWAGFTPLSFLFSVCEQLWQQSPGHQGPSGNETADTCPRRRHSGVTPSCSARDTLCGERPGEGHPGTCRAAGAWINEQRNEAARAASRTLRAPAPLCLPPEVLSGYLCLMQLFASSESRKVWGALQSAACTSTSRCLWGASCCRESLLLVLGVDAAQVRCLGGGGLAGLWRSCRGRSASGRRGARSAGPVGDGCCGRV